VAQIAQELTARLGPHLSQERLAEDLRELTPHYERILVNGYSQGSCISAAAIAQLPQEQINKISLVTVGSPLRRLYGRGFPIYFGPDCLDDLRELLGGREQARWRNAVRKSDYIGGFVFADPYGDERLEHFVVDKAVLDPVCVTPGDGDDATVPVIHAHSDFWPDPQVALMTSSLLAATRHEPESPVASPVPVPSASATDGAIPTTEAGFTGAGLTEAGLTGAGLTEAGLTEVEGIS
jgi:pimeloyl-ACP methyl ester carboxylesterase